MSFLHPKTEEEQKTVTLEAGLIGFALFTLLMVGTIYLGTGCWPVA